MPRILRFQIDASYDGRKVVHFLRGEAGLSARLVQFSNGCRMESASMALQPARSISSARGTS